ncbi:hypothetical protein ERO13_1Z049732v2 [Gossypium hirsutum]|nr:hypothetical protein ERO13_1Z049732v2 [Gossypium hirsutum]
MKIPHKLGCIKYGNDGFYIYRHFKGLIFNIENGDVSDIKLIETDTTLDLSQKNYILKFDINYFHLKLIEAARTQAPTATNYDVGSPSWETLKQHPSQVQWRSLL